MIVRLSVTPAADNRADRAIYVDGNERGPKCLRQGTDLVRVIRHVPTLRRSATFMHCS